MVKGLELFRDRFREFQDAYVLIGGAACHEWFTHQGADLTLFLNEFNELSPAWPAIQAALKNSVAGGLQPAALHTAIQTYFLL